MLVRFFQYLVSQALHALGWRDAARGNAEECEWSARHFRVLGNGRIPSDFSDCQHGPDHNNRDARPSP